MNIGWCIGTLYRLNDREGKEGFHTEGWLDMGCQSPVEKGMCVCGGGGGGLQWRWFTVYKKGVIKSVHLKIIKGSFSR